MLGFGKPKAPSTPPAAPRDIRDTLFGDLPIDAWPPSGAPATTDDPWGSFIAARNAIAQGRPAAAIQAWQRVLALPNLESRHYAQAWTFLRGQGVQPSPEQAKHLLGVIIEVPLDRGLDLLAAYPERSARYYNQAGGGIVWERPNESLDEPIVALLSAGQRILNEVGPWENPRPPAPNLGQVRINMLSPAGLHIGQAAFDIFAKDPLAKPAIDAGVLLMKKLIEWSERMKK